MRPARIRVFDGLRIATEHVEHLQTSLNLSIEELREVAGLGKVMRGFAVSREGDGAITVGPGLAFDGNRRRLALDEPERIEVSFPPGHDVAYLCVKHERVEDGEVEGTPTLVWDSVAFVFEPAPPEPGSELLAIARLARQPGDEGPGFAVLPLAGAAPGEPAAEPPADATPGEPPGDATPGDATSGDSTPGEPPGDASTPGDGSSPPADAAPADGTPTGTSPVEVEPAEPQPTPAAEPGASAPAAASTRFHASQGVLRLPVAGIPPADPLPALVTALRGLESGATPDVRVPISLTEVALDFAPTSVSCVVEITATLTAPDGGLLRLESVGRGEATFDTEGASRFGLSTTRLVSLPAEGSFGWSTSELTETALATLALGPSRANGAGTDVLEAVRFVLDVQRAAPSGLGVTCSLEWNGPVDEERLLALEARAGALSWEAVIGWKALAAIQVAR